MLEKQIEYNNKIINFTVLIYESEKLIMILPLNIKEYYKIKILNWSGFPFSDYNSPLIASNKNMASRTRFAHAINIPSMV